MALVEVSMRIRHSLSPVALPLDTMGTRTLLNGVGLHVASWKPLRGRFISALRPCVRMKGLLKFEAGGMFRRRVEQAEGDRGI